MENAFENALAIQWVFMKLYIPFFVVLLIWAWWDYFVTRQK